MTFVETQLRAGHPPHPAMAPDLPAILRNGVGGIVVATGDGVDRALAGRRVVTTTGGRGGYAQRAVADERLLIEIPLPVRSSATSSGPVGVGDARQRRDEAEGRLMSIDAS